MIDRYPDIDTVQQVADAIGDGIVWPVAGLAEEGEKTLGRRHVAAGAGAHAVEELAVLCYSTAKGRFTSVLTDCPYFGQVQQAFQQRHRHLQ